MEVARALFIGLLATALAGGAGGKLELRGRLEPVPPPASVALQGSDFPYRADTLSDLGGRFRFRSLDPGTYTVIVFLPGRGEVRRTVSITPSHADRRGRIAVTIPFDPSGEGIEAAGTVSARQLQIPGRAWSEFRKAQDRLRERDEEGANRHLLKAVEIAPGFVEAWNNLGTNAYQTRRYEDAEKYFREALRWEPGAYSPVVNLGGTLLSLKRYEEALPYNRHAVEQRPDEALPHSQIGLNYLHLGDDEKALRHLKEARRIDPSHFSFPQLNLALIYTRRGEREAAIGELEDFLARHPDSGNAPAARKWIEALREAR
jgi:Tfp pilus assembly protein PilF